MAIVKKKVFDMENKKITIHKNIMDESEKYCQFAGVSFNEFAEQAFEFLLSKDKDWLKEKERVD